MTDRSLALVCSLVSVALPFVAVPHSYASDFLLKDRYDKITTSVVSGVAHHVIGFTLTQLSVPVGSVSIEFCGNSPIIGDPCTPPSGFDASATALSQQSGESGFSIGPGSNATTIILTRPAALPTGQPAQYDFNNIINPSATGSYYARLQTFTSTDATGLAIEQGGVVFAITDGLSINVEVPPYLIFCAAVTVVTGDCGSATSYFIDVGEFSTTKPTLATSEFQVATNAAAGYSVAVTGPTLTSGNNTVTAMMPGAGSSPGTAQFGINLRKNTAPSVGEDPQGYPAGTVNAAYAVPNIFRYQTGDVVASSVATTDYKKFTVSYLINIPKTQPAGIYATTMTYICLANF